MKSLKENLNSIVVKTFGLCKDSLPEAKFAQEKARVRVMCMEPNVVLMQPPHFSGGTDLVFEQMTTVELAEKGKRNTDEPALPLTSVVCLAKREPLYSRCGFVSYSMQQSTRDLIFLTLPFVLGSSGK